MIIVTASNNVSFEDNEDCNVTNGSKVLPLCEAKPLFQLINHFLMTDTIAAHLVDWSEKSIIKIAPFRSYLAQRKPWKGLTGLDRSQRLGEVIDILIGMGVFVPMSVKETVMEIGEVGRNKGSFVRVVNIHRLKRAAGIDVVDGIPSNGIQPIVREAPLAYDDLLNDILRSAPAAAE